MLDRIWTVNVLRTFQTPLDLESWVELVLTNDSFQAINLDSLVKSSFHSNVFYDLEGKLISSIWMRRLDLVCFGLRPHSGDYCVPMFEQNIEDMSGDESAATCLSDQYSAFYGLKFGWLQWGDGGVIFRKP